MNLTTLTERALAGELGPDPARMRVSTAFTTRQGVRHDSRGRVYRNHVISLRVGRAVGSCAVEPDEVADSIVEECVGVAVAGLLAHPVPAVRVAALDAYLMSARPHRGEPVTVPAGTSLEKSLARAAAVVDLLPGGAERVLVVGVVNSLLHHLRERGVRYVPCDLKGGSTEWGEPVTADAATALDGCDAVLASGMTLGNGGFGLLLEHARAHGKPLVMFAQTGSAILPCFLGAGVTAVSAEPYPFFWLDGGDTVLFRYRERA
ncbi:Rossmann-like domain-containing protein [Planomonospora corallina]|uniref:Rossmann-like domain-containing protein n=1 Tax=Planomonospora corallina TaxID=1806052 RepID=A0ABV8I4D0_9ACTN